MAALQYFFLAAVTIVSVQGYTASKPLTLNLKQDTINGNNNVVEYIKSNTHNYVKEATSTFKSAVNDVITSATKEHQKALREVEELAQKLLKELERGGTIECIQANKDQIHELVKKIGTDMGVCLQGTIETVLEIYKEYVEIMNNSYETIFNIVGEYYECTDSECKGAVIEKLLFAMIEINGTVRGIIAAGVEFISSQLPAIFTCVKGVNENYKNEIADIVNNIKECKNNNQ